MSWKGKPHIVIFNPDQWRGDVMGHLGNPAAVTPNIDRWATSDAVSFSRAYCQSPLCTPSRSSYMTGWYPHVRGHRTINYMLQPDEPVLLKALKEAGYFVWWGGKNDLVPAENGFDAYCDVKYKPPTPPHPMYQFTEEVRGQPDGDTFYSFFRGKIEKPDPDAAHYDDSDWADIYGAIDLIRNAPPDRPLCIYLPLHYPHPPYAVEEPWFSMINRNDLPPRIPAPKDWDSKPSMMKGLWERYGMQSWSEDQWNELRAVYYGMCARVDTQFSMIVNALKESGMYDDTALFFFSDHGDYTGDFGLIEKIQNAFHECLVRVPLIIKPPKSVPVKPGITDALVELIDFPATVEALAGITPGHTHFGRSLLPLLAGETGDHREAVFSEGGRIHGEIHCMGPEFPKDHIYWPRISLQRSEGPEHTKAVMCRTKDFKYVRRLYEQDELYDLRNDPKELKNVSDLPDYREVVLAMRERILDFMIGTGDVVSHHPNQREAHSH